MRKLLEIPIDKIETPDYVARNDLSPESVTDLVDSIRELGIIEPLIVKKTDDGYKLIAGWRRLTAATYLEMPVVPCIIFETDEEKEELLKLHENIYRRNFTPIEEARFIKHLIDQFGWTQEQVSERLKTSPATISLRLAILNYPDDIKRALEHEVITLGVARQLAKVSDDTVRTNYLQLILKGGANERTVSMWQSDWEQRNRKKQGEFVPDTPKTDEGQQSKYQIPCAICSGDLDPTEAQVLYAHPKCWDAVKDAM